MNTVKMQHTHRWRALRDGAVCDDCGFVQHAATASNAADISQALAESFAAVTPSSPDAITAARWERRKNLGVIED
jgi:hypothetical protein